MWMYKMRKKNLAPFAWIFRMVHPLLISRWIRITLSYEMFLSAAKNMAKKIPVIICIVKNKPAIDPNVQRVVIF